MIIIFRKSKLILAFLFILLGVFGVNLLKNAGEAVIVSSVPNFGKRVVLDAGHGIPDGGAVAEDGTEEADINLKITSFLQGFLEKGGSYVTLTRADENGIFDEDAKNIKQKKRSDIKNREKMMNGSDADVFISIHLNKFPENKYSGPQVFHSKNEESKLLAEKIQKRMIEFLNPDSKREIKPSGGEIYLLKNAKIPAVLVECGFLSNPKELSLLKDEEYQKQTAWAIYCGICDYFAGGDT